MAAHVAGGRHALLGMRPVGMPCGGACRWGPRLCTQRSVTQRMRSALRLRRPASVLSTHVCTAGAGPTTAMATNSCAMAQHAHSHVMLTRMLCTLECYAHSHVMLTCMLCSFACYAHLHVMLAHVLHWPHPFPLTVR